VDSVRDLVFISSGGGVYIIDVSDPANPVEIGYCYAAYSAVSAYVHEPYIYVANFGAGLQIYENLLAVGVEEELSKSNTILVQNRPNPFGSLTAINYQLPAKSRVSL
jgi:hypothetical protein